MVKMNTTCDRIHLHHIHLHQHGSDRKENTNMVKMNTIAGLVVLCMVSAVAAFFLPNAVGTVLSFVSIGAAAAIGVLAIVAFVRLLTQRRAF